MSNPSDLIILGGGCAGLSLGRNLAKQGEASPRTLILEGGKEYANDRTWCFWGGFGADSEKLASHRWESFSITTAKNLMTRSCKENPYLMVASKDFYKDALGVIAQASRITLKMENIVSGEILKRDGQWHVETPTGVYTAPRIVDTRPKVPKSGALQPLLWQSFLGEEITTEEEIFDPGCAELMDFSGSSSERILFLYVLPFSKREALVEATVFGPERRARQTTTSRVLLLKRQEGAWNPPHGGICGKSAERSQLRTRGTHGRRGQAQQWVRFSAYREVVARVCLGDGQGPSANIPSARSFHYPHYGRTFSERAQLSSRTGSRSFLCTLFQGGPGSRGPLHE